MHSSQLPYSHGRRKAIRFGRRVSRWCGSPGVLAAVLLGALTMLVVILINGLAYFWPTPLEECNSPTAAIPGPAHRERSDGRHSTDFPFDGQQGIRPEAQDSAGQGQRHAGRRPSRPRLLWSERQDNGDFYGVFAGLKSRDLDVRTQRLDRATARRPCGNRGPPGRGTRSAAAESPPSATSASRCRTPSCRPTPQAGGDRVGQTPDARSWPCLARKIEKLQAEIAALEAESRERVAERSHGSPTAGECRRLPRRRRASRTIALIDVVRACQPNAMGCSAKLGHYLARSGNCSPRRPASRTPKAASCRQSSAPWP